MSHELRQRLPFRALLLSGFVLGAGIGAAAVPVSDGPTPGGVLDTPGFAQRSAARPPETLAQVAARELERSRSDRRRMAPTLDRARIIARNVQPGYRLSDGRRLAVNHVGTTLAVAAMSLPADESRPARRVATDNGIHFAICPARARCPYPGTAAVPAARALPRRLALELAVRTFLETAATVVVVSLPAREPAMLIFERGDLLQDVDARTLLDSLPHDAALVDRLTGSRLFSPSGLEALSDTRESLVFTRLGTVAA